MYRYILAGVLAATLIIAHGLHGRKNVIYAQSLPYVATVTWSPNAASENVVQYQTTLDSGSPVTTLATSCIPSVCTSTVSIPTYGAHTVSVVAQNYRISGDPTSTQSSSPATLSFSLNQAPNKPSTPSVK